MKKMYRRQEQQRTTGRSTGAGLLRRAAAAGAVAAVMLLTAAGCDKDVAGSDDPGAGAAGRAVTLAEAGIAAAAESRAAQTRGAGSPAAARTRAADADPTAASWQGFVEGDVLNVRVSAGTGAGAKTSAGTYLYAGDGTVQTPGQGNAEPAGGPWRAVSDEGGSLQSADPARWPAPTGNSILLWRGPKGDDGKVYGMPETYDLSGETTDHSHRTFTSWDGITYHADNEKGMWMSIDLLHCREDGVSAPVGAYHPVMEHSMAQLCVMLVPGNGVTAADLENARVELIDAARYFRMEEGRPVIADKVNLSDITLMPGAPATPPGMTSAAPTRYGLMLPGQTFAEGKGMIRIADWTGAMAGKTFTYTPAPGQALTTTAGTCHRLVLRVGLGGTGALSVTSHGWEDPTEGTGTEVPDSEFVVVDNLTPGRLVDDNPAMVTTLGAATKDNPISLMITGSINDSDLEGLKGLMQYKDGNNATHFNVKRLYLFATGATKIPEGFCQPENNRNSVLQEIRLPEGIKEIGAYAFHECTALKEIDIPEGVEAIKGYAFTYCQLPTRICLPQSVKEIGDGAFASCSALKEINIPEGVGAIKRETFAYCTSLPSIHLPQSVKEIEDIAFARCTALQSIVLSGTDGKGGAGMPAANVSAFINCGHLSTLFLTDVTPELFSANESMYRNWVLDNGLWTTIYYGLIPGSTSLTDPNNYQHKWTKQ